VKKKIPECENNNSPWLGNVANSRRLEKIEKSKKIQELEK
jgi:hypothetical protein